LIVSVAAQAGARHRSRDLDWASVHRRDTPPSWDLTAIPGGRARWTSNRARHRRWTSLPRSSKISCPASASA